MIYLKLPLLESNYQYFIFYSPQYPDHVSRAASNVAKPVTLAAATNFVGK